MPRVARRARGHRRRTIAHRPGHRDQARPPRDSWPFRRDPAVFVPWADVEQIVIYPRPGYRQAARPSASGSSAARAPRTSTRATNQHPAAARRPAWPPGQPGRSPAGGLTATAWPPPPPRSHQAFPSSTPTLALTRALKGQQLVSPIRWERFYIPEGAGRCQAANVPVLVAFPGRVLGTPGGGPGSRSAPGWTNDLEAGPAPGSHWIRPGTAMGYVGGAPRAQVVSLGRLAAAFIPSGCPQLVAAGAWGGFACGQRDQSDQAAARRWRGPVIPAITRCLRPGLLTPPSARRWPGRGPGRRASRRRPR
jgi:hypothetical protein